MISRKTSFIFWAILFLPLFYGGCREEEKSATPSAVSMEIPSDTIEAQIKRELKEELERLGVEPPWEIAMASSAKTSSKTPLMAIKEEIDETLKEAESIDDPQKKESIHVDLIKRLTLLREYNEATKLVPLVHDADERDSLLEDIARIRMSDVLQEYAMLHQLSDRNLANIQGAMESARLIHDLVRQAKALGNIAFFQANMKDRAGCFETARETIDAVQRFSDDDPRKARGLVRLARLLVRIEKNDEAEKLCRKVQALSASATSVEDRVRILSKLADMFMLLGQHSLARSVCLEGIALNKKIDAPKNNLSLLLDLIDVFLRVHDSEKDVSAEEWLRKTRQIVLDAAAAIPVDVSEKPEPAVFGTISPVPGNGDEGLPLTREDNVPLLWSKIKIKKNETLRTIAMMQTWQGTLEDVWETIENIDDPEIRDDAVVETIDMMIATKAWEDAAGWSDEISHPTLRKTVRRKIRNALAATPADR